MLCAHNYNALFSVEKEEYILLRGTIVNRTYGKHKNLNIFTYFYQQLVLFTMVPRNI